MNHPKEYDKRNVPSLQDVLRQASSTYGWNSALAEEQAKALFLSLVPEVLKNRMTSIQVRKGVIFARFDSPAARQNLLFQKEALLKEINGKMRKEVLREIVCQ